MRSCELERRRWEVLAGRAAKGGEDKREQAGGCSGGDFETQEPEVRRQCSLVEEIEWRRRDTGAGEDEEGSVTMGRFNPINCTVR